MEVSSFLLADFLLGIFFRLYILRNLYISTQEIFQILLMYEAVFKCNKSPTIVYNPNYSSRFPLGWY